MAKIIGANVRAYQELKGWSQEVTGTLVGLSQSGVSKVEHGQDDLTLEKAWVLRNHFGCRMEVLEEDNHTAPPPSPPTGPEQGDRIPTGLYPVQGLLLLRERRRRVRRRRPERPRDGPRQRLSGASFFLQNARTPAVVPGFGRWGL